MRYKGVRACFHRRVQGPPRLPYLVEVGPDLEAAGWWK